ncbi:NAD(P)-dependent dehydrogenase, short-chain alcohol dehydrogenase family [Pseudonocardia thermophila]|uniref:NAD(P)-dependent dehydrogenase, short-chain alcohol dehydrogenase family n=1 Tax=Pseudonocardia thermophila TaxID=1848 RepID=A0A1M6UMX3_PSETH|nr:SDR family NAD(P)-dependent oxidoreductase [Pseudonocardia thermophila]SHK70574.1 NAD(P)-dependent dehydrogenase, short-chain alcohol dehydrogenase family [Pseudonocardia thermophila]
MTGRLAGRTAIVTGAASGIGRETALVFAREGAAVLAVDRDADGLAETVAQGEELAVFAIDLTERGAAAAVFAACAAELGPPDTVANIAGAAGDRGIEHSTDEDLDRYVELNLGITFRMCREAVAVLGEGGSIVNTSSAVALTGMRGTAPYSAAKAAISGLARQLAADHGRRGIRVNAVAPGLIRTPATAERIDAGVFDETVTRSRPLARVGTPRDVANAFAFLASDDAAFITGVTLPVCGGWTTTRFRG